MRARSAPAAGGVGQCKMLMIKIAGKLELRAIQGKIIYETITCNITQCPLWASKG